MVGDECEVLERVAVDEQQVRQRAFLDHAAPLPACRRARSRTCQFAVASTVTEELLTARDFGFSGRQTLVSCVLRMKLVTC